MFLKKESAVKSRNTVVLVHGICDTALKMRHLGRYLSNQGWTVYAISLSPNSGHVGIGDLGQQLKSFIDRTLKSNIKIDLVGFSMGGLVCRYYIQRLGGIHRTQRLVTLSSPHYGTWVANLFNRNGAREMRRHSEFLQSLNHDIEEFRQLKITSVYSPFDLVILPARSSRLPFAKNIIVSVLFHPFMISDKRCLKIVETELSL